MEAHVHRRVIIPPNFTNRQLSVNYFTPRFKKVNRGEDVQWVNEDNETHRLEFYDLTNNREELLFDSGPIESNQVFETNFDTHLLKIDYICTLHRNEVGTVIVYQVPEDQMTEAQRLRFLSGIFNIEPPSTLSHLSPH